jgi:hypothetical protein
MNSLVILLTFFILLIIYLLWVPIILFIDTHTNEYYVQLRGLAKARIVADKKEVLKVKMKVLFLSFKFYPFRRKKSSAKSKKIKKYNTNKSSKSIQIKKYIRMLRTFKIKRLFINIDTGNCISNAKLFPLFAFLNQTKGNFKVNFEGRNQMVLHMQNRPINIIKSFIQFKK